MTDSERDSLIASYNSKLTNSDNKIGSAEFLKDLIAIVEKNSNSSSSSVPEKIIIIHSDAGANYTLTNSPLTERFAVNSTRNLFLVDLTGYTEVRMKMNLQTASASANSPKFRAKYRIGYGTSVGAFLQLGDISQVEVSLSTKGHLDTGWISLAPLARVDDVCIGFTELGGDGVADPAFGHSTILFR